MPRFDMNLLPALDALLTEASVTRAARRLGVGQSTMSGMLSRLRTQFDDPLLVPVGRDLEVTPVGRDLAAEVRQTLLAVEALTAPRAPFDPATAHRRFRIMASDYCMIVLLPEMLRVCGRDAPAVSFDVTGSDRPAESVIEGAVDLCISGYPLRLIRAGHAAVIHTQLVFTDTYVCVVDQAHPLTGRVSPEDFARFPHVATLFPGGTTTVEDNARGVAAGGAPQHVRVSSFTAIPDLIRGTEAIGIVPSRLLSRVRAADGLRQVDPPESLRPLEERALWHMRHDRDPAHRWLRGLALRAAAAIDADGTRDPSGESERLPGV